MQTAGGFSRWAAAIGCGLALVFPTGGRAEEIAATDSLMQAGATRVYLDLPEAHHDYLKTEIPWVNYVRDAHLAQVQVLLTDRATGSGGKEYTLTLVGREEFAGVNDTLVFALEPSHTEAEVRSSIARLLKRGLVRYVGKTPAADYLDVTYSKPAAGAAVKDRWDYWVFAASVSGWAQGEKGYDNGYLWSTVSANRVTPALKVNLALGTNYNESRFEMETSTIKSITRSHHASGTVVKSAGDHWSYGLYSGISSSSYSNLDLQAYGGPAVEYNIFPYAECTRRELRVLYEVLYIDNRYIEETIYGETDEGRVKEALSIEYAVKEPWGSVTTSVYGSHYFHDFDKNRLTIYCDLSLRLVRGLSLTIYGNASMLHDLLSPARGAASQEDVLLRRRQIDTQYSYYVSFGFQYSFGSIYSNVVNPRFGN